jgi:hypothetical protein
VILERKFDNAAISSGLLRQFIGMVIEALPSRKGSRETGYPDLRERNIKDTTRGCEYQRFSFFP